MRGTVISDRPPGICEWSPEMLSDCGFRLGYGRADGVCRRLRRDNDCVESTVTLAAAELDSLRPVDLKSALR
jgi:hypothetical protein